MKFSPPLFRAAIDQSAAVINQTASCNAAACWKSRCTRIPKWKDLQWKEIQHSLRPTAIASHHHGMSFKKEVRGW
jgi:hypothetical protein